MAHLQIKNLPEDLHAALRARAACEGGTMTDVIVRMLRRELALPSMGDWLAALAERPLCAGEIDVERLIDEVRADISAEA